MQPLLDSQLQAGNPLLLPPEAVVSTVPLDAAMDIVKDAFTAAGERDIYTGDDVEVWVISRTEGVQTQRFQLKQD
jgi:20S proteasome subunit beta 6